MSSARAFGLTVRSTVDLALPPASKGAVDLEVSIAAGAAALSSWFEPSRGVVTLRGLVSAEVRTGQSIRVRVPDEVDDRAIAHLVVGPAIGLALHQRQSLVLHGSGVVVDGAAVVFVGDAGWGKSTTAAAFLREGADLITDDMALLERASGDGYVVLAGPPWLKLWPEAVDAVGLAAAGPEPIYAGEKKLRVRVPVADAPGGHRISAIYVLQPGDQGGSSRIETVGRREAFVQLTRHSFAASVLERTLAQPWHSAAVAEIVRRVPVRRLVADRNLGTLDTLVASVHADVVNMGGRRHSRRWRPPTGARVLSERLQQARSA